jgi:hypothetical protein
MKGRSKERLKVKLMKRKSPDSIAIRAFLI